MITASVMKGLIKLQPVGLKLYFYRRPPMAASVDCSPSLDNLKNICKSMKNYVKVLFMFSGKEI